MLLVLALCLAAGCCRDTRNEVQPFGLKKILHLSDNLIHFHKCFALVGQCIPTSIRLKLHNVQAPQLTLNFVPPNALSIVHPKQHESLRASPLLGLYCGLDFLQMQSRLQNNCKESTSPFLRKDIQYCV